MRHEFFDTFRFAAIFFISNPIEKRLEEKIWRRQRQIRKTPKKVRFFSFFGTFLEPKMKPLHKNRALMYWPKSVLL